MRQAILFHLKIQDGVPLLKTSKRFYYGTPGCTIGDTRFVNFGTDWVLRRALEHTNTKLSASHAAIAALEKVELARRAAEKAWLGAANAANAASTAEERQYEEAEKEKVAAAKVKGEALEELFSVDFAVRNSGVYKRAYVASLVQRGPTTC